jgi:polyphosphate:AMP phosphotransferase
MLGRRMFESADLGHTIREKSYERAEPRLRQELLDLQARVLEAARFPVLIIIGGVDGAGKGETVNLLNEWMDPRHIETHAFGEASDQERERPPIWRFWRALPPKGKVGVFFGAWHSQPIVDRVLGRIKDAELAQSLEDILHFEEMLADEGALILKFWFHLSKKQQRKRLSGLEKDPETRWRVTKRDWKSFGLYDRFRKVSERALRETSTAHAPWIVVAGADPAYRSLTVGRTLRDALAKRLAHMEPPSQLTAPPPIVRPLDEVTVLAALDLGLKVSRGYERKLEKLQARLNQLSRDARFSARSAVVVFEGSDAAGKGGAIRRVTGALDARFYQVLSFAAPTDEERAQPYLWRFWRHIPRRGRFALFDRSWYGRVMVERVEGFCAEADWMRAYGEINDFELHLARHGVVVVKFWLAISKDEQLRRFQARQKIGFKRFKITREDWRNRAKWPAYEQAVCDMIDRTSTDVAPWHLIEANDKKFARLKILRLLCERLEAGL